VRQPDFFRNRVRRSFLRIDFDLNIGFLQSTGLGESCVGALGSLNCPRRDGVHHGMARKCNLAKPIPGFLTDLTVGR